MNDNNTFIDWAEMPETLQVARLISRQPALFEGRQVALSDDTPEDAILGDTGSLGSAASLALANRFYTAVSAVFLHIHFHPQDYDMRFGEDMWNPRTQSIIAPAIVSGGGALALRDNVMKVVPYLCNGSDNYERMLRQFQSEYPPQKNGKPVSTEVLETQLLDAQLECAAEDYNFQIG